LCKFIRIKKKVETGRKSRSYKKRRQEKETRRRRNKAQKMSTVIFSLSFLILLALIGYAARRWRGQHSFLPEAEQFQLQSPRFSKLFPTTNDDLAHIEQFKQKQIFADQREKLLTWASLVDFSNLDNRPILEDKKLWAKSWQTAIEILTERAVSEDDVRRLTAFCLSNAFDVNNNLVIAFQKIWASAPDARTTAEMFRLAAHADDAETFLEVLIEAEHFVKTGALSEFSAPEICELAESHRWLLSQSSRTSGAGFLIKEKMAELRREITHQSFRRN
jgi:hypothetical protein